MLKDFGVGLEAFEKIKLKLDKILNYNFQWRLKQSAYYTETQLVAVRFGNHWLRGEVLEVDVKNAVDREIPWHTVRLIDTGEIVTLCADQMCTLPKQLSYYPPLAYKCQLNGLVPVRYRWNKSAMEFFKQVTNGELTTVVKNVEHFDTSKTVETSSYQVDLVVPASDLDPDSKDVGSPKNVSDELAAKGMALKII